MRNKKRGKLLAVLLSGALFGTQLPGGNVAEGAAGYAGGICEHHPAHTEECGYQEAAPERPCRHEHTRDCYEYVTSCVHVHTEECYPLIAAEVPPGDSDTEGTVEESGTAAEPRTELTRGAEPTQCAHVCGEESGCVTKTLNCVHEEKRNADGSVTPAAHDGSCGYAPAAEGRECAFFCEICGAPEETGIELTSLSETKTEALTAQTGTAAGSAGSEPSAKTTEAGAAGTTGTSGEEPGTETQESAEKTLEDEAAGTTGTSGEEPGTETQESAEKAPEAGTAGTEGTSGEEPGTETQESAETTPEAGAAGTTGTSPEKPGTETQESAETTPEAGAAGTTGASAEEPSSETEEIGSETGTSSEEITETGTGGINGDVAGAGIAAAVKEVAEETPDSDAETETDEAVTAVRAMIDALPTVEEVERMSPEEQKEVYDDAQDAADAYFDELTEGQQAQVDLARLMDLMNYFNGQVSTMAEVVDSGTGWTLDNEGVLTINSNAAFSGKMDSYNYPTSFTSVVIKNGVTSIGNYAFWDCTSLTSIEIPSSVMSIGVQAFLGCTSLTSIEIPSSVTSIGNQAFYYCASLTSIEIPSGVTSINQGAFSNCLSLKSITIPNSVTSIGVQAFFCCTSLTSIEIPSSVTSIGDQAFYYCTSLTSIEIPSGVTSIGGQTFSNCTSLTSIEIPSGVTSIGINAFRDCSSLKSITIPNSVKTISNYAFYGCGGLTEITLPATAPSAAGTLFTDAWNQVNFIIPENSIGTETGKYNLNASPWSSIVILNGSRLIRSMEVTLMPVVGSVLPAEASCATAGVESSSVSWTSNGQPVEDGTKAGYGESYTAEITLTADTSATPYGYRFVDGITTKLNGTAVTATVSDSGKTLTFSKTYQTKQAQNSPNISIDYQNEKLLNTTTSMEYSMDNGGSWSDCGADMKVAAFGWDGTEKTVRIRLKETEDAYASDPVSVSIPARPVVTVSQVTGSITASSISVQADGVPQGAAVQYQLVAAGGNVDENDWKSSGEFKNLKAGTAYKAYAKCGATSSSFASDISTEEAVSTSAAAYTVSIPSETLTAGDSTSKAEIYVDASDQKPFDLGYNGEVRVKVKDGGAVSSEGKLTLTRQNATDTVTSAMLVNKTEFTNINNPVATFTMDNYTTEKAVISFAKPTGTRTVIPAGTYSGTVIFVVTYSEE